MALLLLVIAIALAVSTYYFSSISVVEIQVDNIEKTRKILKRAKQALIAYAVNYNKTSPTIRGPGYLLCPDTDNDGVGETSCNGPSTVGRLPWKTLNIGDLRDSSNERLWYAVSENFDFTASPSTGALPRKIINTATRGNITVRDNNNNIIYDGTTIDGVVAVIISPGAALTRDDGTVQDRSAVNAAINYLDIDTSSNEDNINFDQGALGGTNDNGFIQGDIFDESDNIIVNDIIEVITYSDIMEQVHRRVSQEISNLIEHYFSSCGAYPEASAFDPTKALFDSAGSAPPAGSELRKGHLPLDSALPINWGGGCTPFSGPPATAPVPAAWLAAEEWHKVTYYEFAYTNPEFPSPLLPPLSAGTVCTPSLDCLDVNGVTDINALIMFSGRDLTGSRPSAVMSDYFEVENNNLDSVYDADETEDYIRVIAP
jgi:hypothetical protein